MNVSNDWDGLSFKLDYDAASGQFISRPASQSSHSATKLNFTSQLVAAWRARRDAQKTCAQLNDILAKMSAEIQNDIGLESLRFPTQPHGTHRIEVF